MADLSVNIFVIGAGNFGTCLAHHLSCLGHKTTIWAREQKVVDGINLRHRNPSYLNSIPLNPGLRAVNSLHDPVLDQADVVLLAIPTQFMRSVIAQIPTQSLQGKTIVCAAKGIELESRLFPLEIISEVWNEELARSAVMLSGPSFAIEVASHQPTAVTAASWIPAQAEKVQKIFHANFFRVYRSEDPMGLEVAGALKNVIAIAAGASRGLGFEANSSAALITRGLAEIVRLGVAKGAKAITFNGLGGVGDLFLTCTSEKSRNFTVGYRLGKGESLEYILETMNSVAEGVSTTKAAYALAQELGVRMPITHAVYSVLYQGQQITEAVRELMAGNPRNELE